MPSRREILAGTAGAVGGGLLTGGSALALTQNDTESAEPTGTQTPTPTTTTVHTSTSNPTTTHTPTPTTISTATTTTTSTSTTTSSEEASCDAERFNCQTISTAKELGMDVRESVIFIEVQYPGSSYSQGTGWFVDDQGHIVTNDHVINNYDKMTVYTLDGTEYTPTVKGRSDDPDAALLKVDHDSTPIPTGSEDGLDSEQPLLEVGHPGTVGSWVISLGRFEGMIEYKNKNPDLKTSIPGARGSSGSPTMNLDGEVVGISFGGQRIDPRLHGETPEPVDPEVHEELNRNVISAHEPISEVMEKVEQWK